jgi:hypothetical protein
MPPHEKAKVNQGHQDEKNGGLAARRGGQKEGEDVVAVRAPEHGVVRE